MIRVFIVAKREQQADAAAKAKEAQRRDVASRACETGPAASFVDRGRKRGWSEVDDDSSADRLPADRNAQGWKQGRAASKDEPKKTLNHLKSLQPGEKKQGNG